MLQTATLGNFPGGTWNITVASSQTCDTTFTLIIPEPAELTVLVVENQQVSWNVGADGVALATALGGTTLYSYQWDNPNLLTTATANLLVSESIASRWSIVCF